MTKTELVSYIETLYKEATTKKIPSDLSNKAVNWGIADFWDAFPWGFKEKHDTITTTDATETVDLPDDFGGILSVVEHTTDDGRRLTIVPNDKYDRLIPYSADMDNDTPKFYKIYYDQSDSVWKIAFYPTPSAAITIYLTYHTVYQNGEIPNKYVGGVVAAIGKYLYMPGTPQYVSAIQSYKYEIIRLRENEGIEVGSISKMLDSSNIETVRTKKWWEDGPWP